MEAYNKTYEVRWADIDPNRHLRHSVYNDYAAQTRVALFSDYGMPMNKIARQGRGPILFREETRFLKEINLLDEVSVTCRLRKMREDGSRWSFLHEIFSGEGKKAAVIEVDGAWLNLESRKLGTPSPELLEAMRRFPRTDDFEWQIENNS